MTISELIKELQSNLDEFGDVDVYVPTEFRGNRPASVLYYDVIEYDLYRNPVKVAIVIEH